MVIFDLDNTLVDRDRSLEPDLQVRATIDRLRATGRQVAITTNGDTRQQPST